MTEREEVLLADGFVLHQRPFRNSSQLLDLITPEHGRVGLVAQGSRRHKSGRRGLLQAFVPLRLSWVRRGDLGRLTHVEAAADALDLTGDRLLGGFYVNELVLRLSARGDANSEVYSCYSDCLIALADRSRQVARTLRLFELGFLRALGYGLELERDTQTGERLRPDGRYVFEHESGPRAAVSVGEEGGAYWGRELLSLNGRLLQDRDSLRAARRLLGCALDVYLGERPLKSRTVLREIVERGLER
jgi:DNA repair protein RecO (recombination protein O)